MFQVKFAICMATYSIGNATENSEIVWLGQSGWANNASAWVDDFDDAKFFDNELDAETLILSEIDGDPRSFSIVKVLCSDYSD